MSLAIPVPIPPHIPLEALLGEMWRSVQGRRVLIGGHLAVAAATLFSGLLVSQKSQVLFVDGANAFDPYIVARYARRIGLHPKDILDREGFLLSRAFTCHQLTILLEERVLKRLEKGTTLLIVSGPFNTFMDESVPWREVKALFRRLQKALLRIGQQAPFLLAQPPVHGSKERRLLLRELTSLVETVAWVEEDEQGPRVRVMKPVRNVLRPGKEGNLALLRNREEM